MSTAMCMEVNGVGLTAELGRYQNVTGQTILLGNAQVS